MILARKFQTFKKCFATAKVIFKEIKSSTMNWTQKVVENDIWEIWKLNNKNEISEYSLKSKTLYEKDKTQKIYDYFFELSLLYLKTNDPEYLKNMKILEDDVAKNNINFSNNLIKIKNDQEKFEINPQKVKVFLRNFFGLNILSLQKKNKKSFQKTEKNVIYFQQFQKILSENKNNFNANDKENLEILYIMTNIFKMTFFDSNNKTDKEILSFIYKSLNLQKFYKKILLQSFQKSKETSNPGLPLLEGEFLLNQLTIISSEPKNQQEIIDFFSLLGELKSIFNSFSLKLNVKLLLVILSFSKNDKNFSQFSMLAITLIKSVSNNMINIPKFDLTLLLYYISKENLSKFNLPVIMNFWQKLMLVFPEIYANSNANTQKNMLYSLGKAGFLSEEIKKIFKLELLNITDFVGSKDEKVLSEKYLNIMKAGFNLKVLKAEDFNFYIEKMRKFYKSDEQKKKKIFFEMAPFALRLKYMNLSFWHDVFEDLEGRIEDSNQNFFQIYFILKVFTHIFNGNFKFFCEGDNKTQLPELFKLFIQANNKEKVQELLKKTAIDFYIAEINPLSKMNHEKYSLLEETTNKCLNSLGVPFISQTAIEFMLIDFYLPFENIVVEVMGPSHFIKTKENDEEMSLMSEFKMNCLKGLGYNVIIINHDHEIKNGLSMEQSFLKQYKEIIKNKK